MNPTPILRILSFTALPALLLCQTALAQQPQGPETGKVGLTLAVESTASGDARLKGGGTTFKNVQVSNGTWTISQEIGAGDAGSFSFGIAYSNTYIDENNRRHNKRDHSADRVPLPDELQSFGGSIGYSVELDPQWTLSAGVGAASHVDGHQLLSKGWGVDGHLMGLYKWSPNLTLAVGLAYDSFSEDWGCVPLFGFEWKPSDKWTVAVGFPRTAVSYTLNQSVTMSLALSGEGGTYRIKNDPRPGTAPRSLADSKLEYTEVRLGFRTDWKINRTFNLSGSAGTVLYRDFEYVNRNYNLRSKNLVPFVSVAFSASL